MSGPGAREGGTAVALSNRDLEVLRGALRVNIDELSNYKRWVDDRPQLPAVEAALGRIDAEMKEMWALMGRLLEAERPAPRPGREGAP